MDVHRRIISINELVHDVLQSAVVTDQMLADKDTVAAIERKIDGVTRAAEGFLHRELIIKPHVVRAQTLDWEYGDDLAVYERLSEHFPVVSVLSPDGVTVVDGDPESIKVESPFAGPIKLLAGYRRGDQPDTGLAWVKNVNGLSAATAIGSPTGAGGGAEITTIELDTAADYVDGEWLALTDDSANPVATVQIDGNQTAATSVAIVAKTVPAFDATNEIYRISYGGGIDQDSVDPDLELLPDDIRDVVVDILVHELTARNENTLGRTKSTNIGQSTFTVQRTDKRFREDQLQRIYHHRRVYA